MFIDTIIDRFCNEEKSTSVMEFFTWNKESVMCIY